MTTAPEAATVTVIRRAELSDVPTVSRLLGTPEPGEPGTRDMSEQAYGTAVRLLLAHVGVDLGEFWVAEVEQRVQAAVVLLPPVGAAGGGPLQTALRVELGISPADLPSTAAGEDVPEEHWLLVPAATAAGVALLPQLLEAALPPVDAAGLPVLCVDLGAPGPDLDTAGFVPLSRRAAGPPLSLRAPVALRLTV